MEKSTPKRVPLDSPSNSVPKVSSVKSTSVPRASTGNISSGSRGSIENIPSEGRASDPWNAIRDLQREERVAESELDKKVQGSFEVLQYDDEMDEWQSLLGHHTPSFRLHLGLLLTSIFLFASVYSTLVVITSEYMTFKAFTKEFGVELISDENCTRLQSDQVKTEHAKTAASDTIFFFSVSQQLCALLAMVLYGSYSISTHRRVPGLTLPGIGLLCWPVFILVDIALFWDNNYWLYAGGVLAGLFGGQGLFIYSANTFMADSLSVENRTFGLMIIIVVFNIGRGFSSIIIGVVIESRRYNIALGLCLIFAFILLGVTFNITEPRLTLKGASCPDLKTSLNKLTSCVTCNQLPTLKALVTYLSFCAFGLYSFVSYDFGRYIVMWLMAPPLCYSSDEIGKCACTDAIISAVVVCVAAVVVMGTRTEDPKFISFTLPVSALGAFIVASITSSNAIYIAMPFVAIASISGPVFRSFVSKLFDSQDIGVAFIFLEVIHTMASLVGTTCNNSIYYYTLNSFKGTVFILAGVTFLLCSLIVHISHLLFKRYEDIRSSGM